MGGFLEIKQLKTFLSVADSRSFQQAASDLYVTRQAVSKTIRQLEEELGLELFTRSHEGVMLTPAGIFLYPRAASLVAEFDQLRQDTMDANRSYVPKITIGLSQSLYRVFVRDLEKYGEAHRDEMDLRIQSCMDLDSDTLLASHKADAVLSVAPPTGGMARTSVLLESPVKFLVNKHSSAVGPLLEDPELWHTMPLLLFTGGNSCLFWKEPSRSMDICSTDLSYLFELLVEGRGILPVPDFLLPNVRGTGLFAVLDCPLTQNVTVYWSTLYPDHYNFITSSYLDTIHDEAFRAKTGGGKS